MKLVFGMPKEELHAIQINIIFDKIPKGFQYHYEALEVFDELKERLEDLGIIYDYDKIEYELLCDETGQNVDETFEKMKQEILHPIPTTNEVRDNNALFTKEDCTVQERNAEDMMGGS